MQFRNRRRFPFRTISYALLLGWVGVLAHPVGADDPPEDRMKPGHCGCSEGKACWHYLRTPMRPPEDPCRCGLCASKGDCSTKERPTGWGADCTGSQKPPCFWKRHAASYGITCLTCLLDTECETCNTLPGLADKGSLPQARKQAALEGDSPKKPMLVAWSEHFYLATDIPRLKLLTQGGAPRIADQHEIVHLFLQRAEWAYDDFTAVWGPIGTGGRTGIYLADRKGKMEQWQAAYFGNAKTNMLYGAGVGKVGGGFCVNGFATSTDDYGNDRDLHAYVRHMIGHLLYSMWHKVDPDVRRCPKWAFAGAADWLCKIEPLFLDWTVFCFDEGQGSQGSGKYWASKARSIAAGRRDPIEKLFALSSESHMTSDDHIRSWSYMDVMLREDRERWLETLKAIRDGKDPAPAFQEGLSMSPDEFDKRWADRLLGKRKTMIDVPKDARVPDGDGPNGAARRRIQQEPDIQILAALIRGLDHVGDIKTAELVLSRLGLDSDLIRETVVMLLSKTTAPDVIEWMRASGLTSPDEMTKAHVARVLGNLKYLPARLGLEALLDDAHWLVRANAARALSDIADPASAAVLVAKIEDSNPKAWIAKADAMAGYGMVTSAATLPVTKRLDASDWQVRLTACRVLAKMGDKDAIDPLILRLETEGGRLRREIHAALMAVSHETFGESAQTWRNWWKKQKPSGIPKDLPPVNPDDDRYAKPKPARPDEATYYGKRIFSQSLLFVLDLSLSMDTFIKVPPEAQKMLGSLISGTKISVAKQAARACVEKLDARTRFNIVFFSTKVNPWQKSLVVAGGMKDAAIAAIQNAALEDETNIFGALRAAVGLHERSTLTAELDPIPDTIYFLTDGTPTRGEITDPDTILSWMRDVNRFAKVELNVIAMGNMGVDLDFLRKLAVENHGEFIHVPDADSGSGAASKPDPVPAMK